jgi:hypothetical protein
LVGNTHKYILKKCVFQTHVLWFKMLVDPIHSKESHSVLTNRSS